MAEYDIPVEQPSVPQADGYNIPVVTDNQPLSSDVADKRAHMADYGLSGKINNSYDQYYSSFISGQEQNVRKYVTAELDKLSAQRKAQQIIGLAQQGWQLTPEDINNLDSAYNDPKSVIEDHYAQRYMNTLNWPVENTEKTTWLRQAYNEMPARVTQDINIGTQYTATIKFLQTMQEDAHENYSQQSWPGWLVDQAKNISTIYPWIKMHASGTSWFNLPGHAQDEARNQLLTLPYEQMKAKYLSIYNTLKADNPTLAQNFADNMVGMSTSDRVMQDVLPIAIPGIELGAVSGVAGMIASRNAIRTAVRQQVLSAASQAGMSPSQQAALAAGNIQSSAVQRAWGSIVNQLRRSDPIKEAEEKLPNIFRVGRKQAFENDMGDLNGTNSIVERYDQIIRDFPKLAQGITGAERTPVLAERFKPAIEAAQDAVIASSRDLSDRVWNISEPYRNEVTGGWYVDIVLGKSPLEGFGTKGEAGRILKGLDGHEIVQGGSSYYAIKPIPVPENSSGMRSMMAKLSTDRTPEGGIVNSFIARFRTPNETQSAWANRNREAATFVSSTIEKYAWEQLEEVRKLQPLLPFGKGTEKWNDWERVLNNARKVYDPDNNKIGYTYKNIGEYQYAYMKQIGRLADDQEVAAYFAFKRTNELDHALRTISIVKHKERLGVMSQKITIKGKIPGDIKESPEFDGIVMDHFPGGHDTIAIVRDDGSVKVSRLNQLGSGYYGGVKTPAAAKESYNKIYARMVQDGQLKVVAIHAPEHFPLSGFGGIKDTDVVRYVLVPPKMLSNKPLDWNTQLPWRGGGHFVYKHNIRLSQADIREEQIGAVKRQALVGVNTGWTIPNMVDGRILEKHVNDARILLQKMTASNRAAARDIVENKLNMDWATFLGWFRPRQVRNALGQWRSGGSPRFNLSEPFKLHMANENLANKIEESEFKSRYSNFEDIRKSSPNQQFMTEFSQERDANEVFTWKNEGTPDNPMFKYEPSPLLDAIPTMNRATNKIANTLVMDDMKIHAVETWVQEAKKFLSIDESRLNSSPLYWFHHADFIKSPLDSRRIAELEAAREQIKSFIGQVSETDAVIGYWTQKLADTLYTNAPRLARWIDPVNLTHTLTDPTRFIRAMTFHMKMGLFALPQILVQGQTYVNILGISGATKAMQGTTGALMHQWSRMNANPNILAALGRHAEKFGYKPGEWEAFREAGLSTGFFNVGSEYALRDNPMSNKVIQTNWGKFLNLGATPFTEGEKNVRFGAWYTAAKEYSDLKPVSQWTNADKLKVLDRAALLNGNMNRASNATFQRGWAALPVQFMTYTLRQAELMWGKRLNPAEKARLLLTNAMAYGLPVGLGITGLPSDFFKNAAIEAGYNPGDNYLNTMLTEGIPSTILALVDHDRYWNVGERFGNTGLNDLLYGDKTIWELAGGAATSTVGSFLEAFDPFRQAIMSGIRQDGNQFNIKYEHLLQPLREITTFNSAERAIVAAKMGNWISKNGDTLLRGITVPEALISFITGLQPQEVSDLRHMQEISKNEKSVQQWATRHAIQEANRSMEAYDKDDPDNGQAFMINAMMYLNVYIPDDLKSQVLSEMFNKWQDAIERKRQSFGTKNVPPWLKDQRMEQWIKGVK